MIYCVEFFPIEHTWLVSPSEDYDENLQVQTWMDACFKEKGYEVSVDAANEVDALSKAYPILSDVYYWRDELGRVSL